MDHVYSGFALFSTLTPRQVESATERATRLRTAYEDFVVEQEKFLVALGVKKPEEPPE